MSRFRVGRRQSKRTKSVVPVRVFIAGSKDGHIAHTLDISNDGVKLGGCRGEMKVGDKIEIQYHHNQAQFRIAWIVAHEGSSEKQVGAECLEPGKQVWGARLPQQADEYEEKE
jgi:PilZ domain